MNTKKATAEFRTEQWIQVIQERQASGMTVKDFCLNRSIKRDEYFYWQHKLRKAACSGLRAIGEIQVPSPKGWMQLSCENETKSSLDIEVNGCRITVDHKTDSELLKNICRLLRTLG